MHVTALILIAGAILQSGAIAQPTERQLPSAPTWKLPNAQPTSKKLPEAGVVKGIGTLRNTVNQAQLPWSAIGRLQTATSSCTGAMIGPSTMLTAAHCVFDKSSHEPFAPQALHFMLRYAQGKFLVDARGVSVTVSKAYDPSRGVATVGSDWAIVQLDRDVGGIDRFLPLRANTPDSGAFIAVGGYAQDHIELLTVDTHCRVMGFIKDASGVPLIKHDCVSMHGVSGAPLLVQDGEAWSVGGIEVLGLPNGGGGAAMLTEVREQLLKLR